MSERLRARRLSQKQAQACENALTPRCRCRCGGQLHGAKRGGEEVPPREWFEELAPDDPHRITTEEERDARRRVATMLRQTRAVLRKLEHDRARLLELGSTANAARLEADIADQRKRLEWLRSTAPR